MLDHLATPCLVGQLDKQRHAQLFIVQRRAMPEPSVISKLFAVIRGEHNGQLIVEATAFEILK